MVPQTVRLLLKLERHDLVVKLRLIDHNVVIEVGFVRIFGRKCFIYHAVRIDNNAPALTIHRERVEILTCRQSDSSAQTGELHVPKVSVQTENIARGVADIRLEVGEVRIGFRDIFIKVVNNLNAEVKHCLCGRILCVGRILVNTSF